MILEIQNVIKKVIKQYATTNSFVSNFAKSSKFAAKFFLFSNSTFRLNASEIEFFNLIYNEKSINIDHIMKYVDKNIYFRMVHLFIERTKSIAIIQNN